MPFVASNETLHVTEDRRPNIPFESTSVDLFSCQGLEFLVFTPIAKPAGHALRRLADHLHPPTSSVHSGAGSLMKAFQPLCAQTAELNSLLENFGTFASDGTSNISRLCRITHRSNGHAEAAVTAMKSLVSKTVSEGNLDVDASQRGQLEWRNTPATCGRSPAQQLFGRPLLSFLPAHHRRFAPEWPIAADTADTTSDHLCSQKRRAHDRHACPLCKLSLGCYEDVQDPRTKLWSTTGVIVAIGKNRDYFVKLPSGRVHWRKRCFLRPLVPAIPFDLPPLHRHRQPSLVVALADAIRRSD